MVVDQHLWVGQVSLSLVVCARTLYCTVAVHVFFENRLCFVVFGYRSQRLVKTVYIREMKATRSYLAIYHEEANKNVRKTEWDRAHSLRIWKGSLLFRNFERVLRGNTRWGLNGPCKSQLHLIL